MAMNRANPELMFPSIRPTDAEMSTISLETVTDETDHFFEARVRPVDD